ncbi:MAG: twin arginine-targeting protein translocase TatC [Bdellovibrionales bacterium RIFOXYB1_FULL_37_110]|nr:MAG: twin arginine-targeting protein translocase TatC [Bdellovibrionales bacterium RIFOXYC1_FULL_37_79]OFZ58365.1 MAG: twin arginine-targeting protein translocase TatC [Bdellovibrionales bacterium RIFOXYB1_FULL_37_110]OFZ62703.1 MAG: twin arginine-targeting protein translocase TatC [Bdellovibrionales bacterium RIFOXYD1_FULL_36_51]
MELHEHLKELRLTCIKIALIIFVGFIICSSYGDQIASFLLIPLRDALKPNEQIIFTGILDKIISFFQISFYASIIFSSPFWTFQIWSFIKPALYEKEIRLVRPFIIISFLLFLSGVLFGYYVVFPSTFSLLLNFGVSDVLAMPNLKTYLIFSIKVLVFLGFIFQFPMVIFILGLLNIVSYQSLKKTRPYTYIGLAIISAIFTPPDVLTMLCLWIPLIILFEIGTMSVYIRTKFLSK